MKLSPTQRAELGCVLSPSPRSIHEFDREPGRWLRGVERRSTVEAFVRAGLAESWQHDYPIGGYRARLTDAGLVARAQVLAEEGGLHPERAAVAALLDAVRGVG